MSTFGSSKDKDKLKDFVCHIHDTDAPPDSLIDNLDAKIASKAWHCTTCKLATAESLWVIKWFVIGICGMAAANKRPQ